MSTKYFPKYPIQRIGGKIEQILLAHNLLKETVLTIIMSYRNTKVKVCSSDGDTEFFDIVASILIGNTLLPYLFIIHLDYVVGTSIDLIKENALTLKSQEANDIPQKLLRTRSMQMI